MYLSHSSTTESNIKATVSNQRAKKTILMSNGLRVLTLLAETANNLRLGPFLAIKALQDMLMTNSSPTNSGPPPRYVEQVFSFY